MTNVLIVDDEILVRLSLKTLIPWQEHGFYIVGEAQNGREALAIMERTPCHIVLTDIRMPEMDGLELISRIRALWPFAKCVILSNHNDFEYVQQALRLGAVDYLLKLAWAPEELLAKCKRMQEELQREELLLEERHRTSFELERLGREAKEKLLRDLLTKHMSRIEVESATSEVEFGFLPSRYRVAAAAIDQYEGVLAENRFESEQLLSYTIANILNEMIRKYGGGEVVEVENGRFALLSSQMTADLLSQMKVGVESFAKVSLSFGVSREYYAMYDLHAAYTDAHEALLKRFYRGGGAMIWADRPAQPASGHLSRPGSVKEEFWIRLFEARSPEAILPELAAWYGQWKEAEAVSPDVARDEWLHLLYMYNKTLEPTGKDIYTVPAYRDQYPFDVIRNGETLSEIFAWFCGWLTQTIGFVKASAGTKYRPEIQAVLDIIHQEYHTPLKVADMARRVGFAENYLSVLFRKETGEKIMDTLTSVRMNKARKLLQDPALKIYEISELVGYNDANHFSKYFKKIEGVFPLEYRKMVLGK